MAKDVARFEWGNGRAMICDFCHGTGRDREYTSEDCADCAGTGIATCGTCGSQDDVMHGHDGPEYICMECLSVELSDALDTRGER